MPKEKQITQLIPKLYKRKFEDLGLFFFVEAQKQIVPTITACQAINNYYKFIGDEYIEDINSLCVTLSRMRAEFIDLKYNQNAEDKK